MADWFLNLPMPWMGFDCLCGHLSHRWRSIWLSPGSQIRVGNSLQGGIARLVTGARASFRAIGGLHCGRSLDTFDKQTAVTTEASALRAVVLLARNYAYLCPNKAAT